MHINSNRICIDESLKKMVLKLCISMLTASLVSFLVTLIWGFDLKNLIGFIIGGVYISVCMIYLSMTITKIVNTDCKEKKAEKMMGICYAVRFSGLFILCLMGSLFNIYSVVGVVIPQLFPRIIFVADHFLHRNFLRKE